MTPIRSLSRTGRPLTNRYCPSELARLCVGSPAKPSTTTPSRSAWTSTALARKSAPRMSASRASLPGAPGKAAGHVTVRSSLVSVKATSGRLIASRRTTSRTASASLRSLLRNFSRAGVA